MDYIALIPSGISHRYTRFESACEDAIFRIKSGSRSSIAIYQLTPIKLVFMGMVEKKGTTYRFVSPGSNPKTLNKNGSFRKAPEPKPFLR